MRARAGLLLAALFPVFSAARHDAKKGAEEYRNKKFDAAEQLFARAAAREPSDPLWNFDLGTARATLGKGDARGPLEKAAGSPPSDPRLAAAALYQLGTLELRDKKYSQAVSFLRKSLELDPLPAETKRNFEIALKNARKEKPPPQGGGAAPPEKPAPKKSDLSEFQKKAGLTPQEAEAMLRALDAEQSRREKPAAKIRGKDW
jgi:tetratricopeptide (TPR) repeat protein